MMNVYVPSHARATYANFAMGPLPRIPSEYRGVTHMVVPRGQGAIYAAELAKAELGWVRVLETPEGMRGIGPTRHWMGQHAAEHGADKFLMMDDDIDFLIRKSPEDWALRAQTEAESLDMFRTMENYLSSVAMVGISDRAGNNRPGVGGPDHPMLVACNTRIMRMFAVRTADWLEMEHGRVEVMEDFDLTLQLLRNGRGNVNLFYWANGQKMTNMEGGCSTYRTHEVQDRAARELQRLHGERFVALRLKQNKTDAEGLGTRTEVTIYWKKAAASHVHD